MKLKPVINLTSMVMLSSLLSGCGDGPNYQDADAYAHAQPVIVEGDLLITLHEGQGEVALSLVKGVTNPSATQLYTREFDYLEFKQDELGNEITLTQGPELQFAAIRQSGDTLLINTDVWNNLLVHPATKAKRDGLAVNNDLDPTNDTPELYTSGVYHFTYKLDNGAPQIVERNLVITILGKEDKVTDVEINHSDGFSVPKGFNMQFSTTIVPENATFSQLVYKTSDSTIASINTKGVINGLKEGEVNFTVATLDGNIVKTVSAVVEPLTAPVGVDIRLQGESVTKLSLAVEDSVQLSSVLLPEGFGFGHEVLWAVSPLGIVELDEQTGKVTALAYDSSDPQNNVANIYAYLANDPSVKGVMTITTEASPNLLFEHNGNFETGDVYPWTLYSETPEGAFPLTIAVEHELTGEANHVLHFGAIGTEHAGIRLNAEVAPQALGQGQARQFEFSYDIKMNNYDGNEHPLRFYFVADGAFEKRIEQYHTPIKSGDWTSVSLTLNEKDYRALANNGRIDLFFVKDHGPVDAYIDNLRLEVIE